MKKKTHEEYELELFHREINYFPMEPYNGTHTPILHECLNGHQWLARPKHILNGHGCPICAGNILKTDEQYKLQLKDRSFINIEPYIKDGIKIKHKCFNCNHIWSTAPSYILQGTGCPMCAHGSFDKNKSAILYHVSLEFLGKTIYKIGITNNSVKQRFKQDWNRLNMKLIWEVSYDIGLDAKIAESNILQQYERYKGIYPLRGKGNTELLKNMVKKPY